VHQDTAAAAAAAAAVQVCPTHRKVVDVLQVPVHAAAFSSHHVIIIQQGRQGAQVSQGLGHRSTCTAAAAAAEHMVGCVECVRQQGDYLSSLS
jgi:hypothetical protein